MGFILKDADLDKLFASGKSPLLCKIARLCIVYCFRNAIGGHVEQKAVDQALMAGLFKGATGSVRWRDPVNLGDGIMSLEIDLAHVLLGGVIQTLLPPGSDARVEIGKALEDIMGSFTHIQQATNGLVHAFLGSDSVNRVSIP